MWVYNRPFDNHTILEGPSPASFVSAPLYKGDLYVYTVIGVYGDSVKASCAEGDAAYGFVEVIPIDIVSFTDFPTGAMDGTLYVDRPETIFTITMSDSSVSLQL